MLTDIHTHSDHSFDGRATLFEMVARAKALRVRYYGVSDHFDHEFLVEKITIGGKRITATTDAASYFEEARAVQKAQNADDFTLLVGGEFAFHPSPVCTDATCGLIEKYRPDFIVNSVHTVGPFDAWCPDFFAGRSKEYAYSLYFERVIESLSAPYAYDIVAHLGYVSRNAPYPDRKLHYEEFRPFYDEILRTIVKRDKILEVNTSSRGAGSPFLPDTDVLSRYFELGGRKISFASDAHDPARILEKREPVAKALKDIGFTNIAVPVRGEHLLVPLE